MTGGGSAAATVALVLLLLVASIALGEWRCSSRRTKVWVIPKPAPHIPPAAVRPAGWFGLWKVALSKLPVFQEMMGLK